MSNLRKFEHILNEGISQEDLANTLCHRIEMRYPDIYKKYDYDAMYNAVDDVASFHAGREELGSSDINMMIRQVFKRLEESEGLAEGSDQELVKRQVSYWDQNAKETKNKERKALTAKKAEYEKTPAGKAEKYWGKKGVAEGDIVQFPKKHPYELLSNCPKCGGQLQGGKDEKGKLKLCMPCMKIYRAPNQHGVAEGYSELDNLQANFEATINRILDRAKAEGRGLDQLTDREKKAIAILKGKDQGVAEGSGPQAGDEVYYGNRLVGWFKGYSKFGKIITEPNVDEMGDEYLSKDAYWDPQPKITIKPKQGVAEEKGTLWRIHQSEATGRYHVVKGYNKDIKMFKNKMGAGDFNSKEAAQAKADELNKGVSEDQLEEIDRRGFLRGAGAAAIAGAAGNVMAGTRNTNQEYVTLTNGDSLPVYNSIRDVAPHILGQFINTKNEKPLLVVAQDGKKYFLFMTGKDIRGKLIRSHGSGISEDNNELKCWTGYKRVPGTKSGEPGSCEEIEEGNSNELSTDLLARYKTAAGADATAADKAGDFARGNTRFTGIVKATKKQFDNETKPKKESAIMKGIQNETLGTPYPGTYEQEYGPFKRKGQERTMKIAFEGKKNVRR